MQLPPATTDPADTFIRGETVPFSGLGCLIPCQERPFKLWHILLVDTAAVAYLFDVRWRKVWNKLQHYLPAQRADERIDLLFYLFQGFVVEAVGGYERRRRIPQRTLKTA